MTIGKLKVGDLVCTGKEPTARLYMIYRIEDEKLFLLIPSTSKPVAFKVWLYEINARKATKAQIENWAKGQN